MKRIVLLAILVFTVWAIAFPASVLANPGVILDPSFELNTNWTYSETDVSYNYNSTATAWKTDGRYSYKFASSGEIDAGAYSQISQAVNFSLLDSIFFDAYLDQATAGIFTASVLVGSTTVWSQAIPITPTEYLRQRIDVSGFTGTQDLIFRITNTSGVASNKNQINFFDNIKTWGSFSDAAHAIRCNNFVDGSTEHVVYVQGESYPSQDYRIIFWNLVGSTWVNRESQVFAPVSGVLSYQHTFTVGDGSWRAAVYNSTTYSPTTFSESDSYLVVWDSFMSQASAIPEFPSVISGVAVMGLCIGIFRWMKKRSKKT